MKESQLSNKRKLYSKRFKTRYPSSRGLTTASRNNYHKRLSYKSFHLALKGECHKRFTYRIHVIISRGTGYTLKKVKEVLYNKYYEDIKTLKHLNRCRRKINEVLQERHLQLSRKKFRLGHLETTGFHFLNKFTGCSSMGYLPKRSDSMGVLKSGV